MELEGASTEQMPQVVQDYLTQHKMRTGLEYQSVFVGVGAATAVGEKTAKRYGQGSIAVLVKHGTEIAESLGLRESGL
jgi:hypothetical protein